MKEDENNIDEEREGALSEKALERFLGDISPEWKMMADTELKRTFQFADFVVAMHFVQKVADVAEKEGHHPDIAISYNKVTLTLSTHDVGGLTEKDMMLAAAIDALGE